MAVAELDRESLSTVKEESYGKIIWNRFRKHKLAVGSMVVMIVIILACVFATVVAPFPPTQINKDENGAIYRNAPPSGKFLMGTDNIGRDVFSRLLYAGQSRWRWLCGHHPGRNGRLGHRRCRAIMAAVDEVISVG
jgi:ABC-type dipeptide/oligopeptide/nickel transport system permease subunit